MKQRVGRRITLIALALLWGAGLAAAAGPPAQPRSKGPVTFTKDVAPLVFKHCAACHRPGEVAPFSLLSYRDVKKRAALISKVTTIRFMPPPQGIIARSCPCCSIGVRTSMQSRRPAGPRCMQQLRWATPI